MESNHVLVDFETFEDVVKEKSAIIICKQRAYFLQDLHRSADFKRFGIVQKLWYEHHEVYHFAIVQFDNVDSAKNLVHQGTIVLCGMDFIVRPYCSVHQIFATIRDMKFQYPSIRPSHHAWNGSPIHHKLFSFPKFSNENILTHLNDYCLSEIFLQMEDICDLSTVMAVCARFKEVGKKAVRSLWKRKTIDFSELKPFGRLSIMDIEKFVSRLGFAVVSVIIDETHYGNMKDVVNPILLLLQKHCPNVKSLTICKHENFAPLQKQTIVEVRPLLSKLSFLKIDYTPSLPAPANYFVHFISSCDQLHTLILNIISPEPFFPVNNFPKLKVFKSNAYHISCRPFLSQNEQIEELDILWQPDLVHLLSNICPNLPKLFLRRVHQNDDLRHLENLKQTNIALHWETLNENIEVIFGIRNISHLRIKIKQTFDADKIYGAIQKLSNLKALEIIYSSRCQHKLFMSKDVMKELLLRATKLEQFTLSLPFPQIYDLRAEDYYDILTIVKSRPHPQKLHAIFDSRTKYLDQKHGMKTIHVNIPQWLMITNRFAYKSIYGVWGKERAAESFMEKPSKQMKF